MGRTILHFFKSLEKLVGHIGVSNPLITYIPALSIKENMRPGDVLLTYKKWQLGSLFILGKWKHAAIVAPDGMIIEATFKGVNKSYILDFLMTKDNVVLLRNKKDIPNYGLHAAEFALTLVGARYDFEFEPRDKEYYCSEVIKKAYKINHKDILLPNDIYEDRMNWEVVIEI